MNQNPSSSPSLKIVVVGGSGLIGRPLVRDLRDRGHTVVVASPSHGINTLTGAGLTTALTGAYTVIDVSNSPSFEAGPVLEFFTRSTSNLLAAAKSLGVRHYVALSVVGANRLSHSGYMVAKVAQENLIRASGLPYTIVRATQFFEFAAAIAHVATVGHEVRVPAADMQPVAVADVSAVLADIALAAPVNGLLELAGPEKFPQADFIRNEFAATGDSRSVVVDPDATYFGARLAPDSLVPIGAAPLLTPTRHADWLAKRIAVASASPAA